MGNSVNRKCPLCLGEFAKLKECKLCKQSVCEKCLDFPMLDSSAPLNFDKCSYTTGCRKCFEANVTIDFSTKADVVGDSNKREIIFIHGAGSCRKMFFSQANSLAERGYRSILMDLPGHGARMDEALTLPNCIAAIKQAVKMCRTKDITIVGGSLGGYILMETLGAEPDLCSKAVVMMCGQNVGFGRSMKASMGLWIMNKAIGWLSQASCANSFLSAGRKNQFLDKQKVMEMLLGGIYFRHGEQNIQLLQNGNYRQSLSKIADKVGILFINGEKDHRDSEHIWLAAAGERSKLLVYKEADHFFSHDTRFQERLIKDLTQFMEN